MVRDKLILGISIILLGIVFILVFKLLFGIGIIMIFVGILSSLNRGENKIEKIHYSKIKKNGGKYGK